MSTDFENDLRGALQREAARAPQLPDGWTPEVSADTGSPHRSRWLLAAACLIVVVGIAGLIAAQRNTTTPAQVSVSDTAPATVEGPAVLDPLPSTLLSVTPPASTDLVPPSTVGSGPFLGSTGMAIGDSRMLGAVQDLKQLGLVIDAAESRQFTDVVGIMQRHAAEGPFPGVVVIDVGNNGAIQQGDLDTLMAQLAAVPTVAMVTTTTDREWSDSNNTMIEALPAVYPNVTVVDFATRAGECTGDCFEADNLNLKPAGQRFYANVIASAVGLPVLPD